MRPPTTSGFLFDQLLDLDGNLGGVFGFTVNGLRIRLFPLLLLGELCLQLSDLLLEGFFLFLRAAAAAATAARAAARRPPPASPAPSHMAIKLTIE